MTRRRIGLPRAGVTAAAAAAALLLAGCTGVTLSNPEPAREVARLAQPPGSVYTGWRVFRDKCAACHGPDATGTSVGPDLLPRVRGMGAQRFVSLVLRRYDRELPVPRTADGAAREALAEDIVQRRQGALTMPAWEGEPRVNANIADLYAWLAARADGTQGPGRPAP